jgi:hypothetical protein
MFLERFKSMRPDNFSHGALCALWTYFEEFESDCGEEIELDVIAICCEWTEYDSALEAAADYSFVGNGQSQALRWLEDRTTVIKFDGGILVAAF